MSTPTPGPEMGKLLNWVTGAPESGPACCDALERLACESEKLPADAPRYVASGPWEKACDALIRCREPSFVGLAAAARRFLEAAHQLAMPHLAMVLARLAGGDCEAEIIARLAADFAGSPLLLDELRVAAALPLRDHVVFVDTARRSAGSAETTGLDEHRPLCALPADVAFAETGLKRAVERLRSIHDGAVPYGADKGFTTDESAVIARLVRIALDRDEPWLPPVLDELFRKVSLAPTAAKSMPSQSVAIALGHAVEALPTPEAIETLRVVLRAIRHAGVEKKLKRNLKGAERGLAGRPDVALRLPADQPVSKAQLTTLRRSLESGLALGFALDYADWCARLTARPQIAAITCTLVWRIEGQGVAVLPVATDGDIVFEDVIGQAVAPAPGARLALWHPSNATAAERDAWRDRIIVLRIKQPFKQAFREHYLVPADELEGTKTHMFEGHAVSVVPFLGLARQEGWHRGYQSMTRPFGRWHAELELADNIYPGCSGWTQVLWLSVGTSSRFDAPRVRLAELPAATLSEMLRSVDLLVSVSSFAEASLDDPVGRTRRLITMARAPVSAMALMRKQALVRILDGMAGLSFDAHHLRLGPYAIHLATGRVTREGEPIEIDPPEGGKVNAAPWLPYDEKLLETICLTAVEIARRVGS